MLVPPRAQAVFGERCGQYQQLRIVTTLSEDALRCLVQRLRAKHAAFGC
jgi:hypothetical protein